MIKMIVETKVPEIDIQILKIIQTKDYKNLETIIDKIEDIIRIVYAKGNVVFEIGSIMANIASGTQVGNMSPRLLDEAAEWTILYCTYKGFMSYIMDCVSDSGGIGMGLEYTNDLYTEYALVKTQVEFMIDNGLAELELNKHEFYKIH